MLKDWLIGRTEPCQACPVKDERIAGLVAEIATLMDMRGTAAKLEELARLEERKQSILATIEALRAKERAEQKERRDLPVMPREGRLPPL